MDETLQMPFMEQPRETSDGIALATDIGLIRRCNEDAVLAHPLPNGKKLIAVADGMGGHKFGDVASWLAVNALAASVEGATGDGEASDSQILNEAVRKANDIILKEALLTSSDMGTTLTAAILDSTDGAPLVVIANIGDSRAYRITGQDIRQITTDHSVAAKLASLGRISHDEVKTHPQAHVLYRTVGAEECDPDIFVSELDPGDRILLCTDGLWNELEDEDIRDIIVASDTPDEACEWLVQEAKSRGGHDNISVVLVHIPNTTSEREVTS